MALPAEAHAGIIVVIGCLYAVCHLNLNGLPFISAVFVCCIVVGCYFNEYLIKSPTSKSAKKLRHKSGNGFFCGLLVPMAVLASQGFDISVTNPSGGDASVSVAMSLLMQALFMPAIGRRLSSNFYHSILASLVISLSSSIFSWGNIYPTNFIGVAVVHGCVIALSQSIIRLLPLSFTMGEATLISHGFTYIFIMPLVQVTFGLNLNWEYNDVTYFILTASTSCLLVVLILVFIPQMRSSVGFYAILIIVASLFSMPVLLLTMNQLFPLWILDYVTKDTTRVALFGYWVLCSLMAALLVYINTKRLTKPAHNEDEGTHTAINIRKHFHIFAIAVFLPGLLLDKEMSMVASSCAIIVFIMLEAMRKVKVWPLGDVLDDCFKLFIDWRDSGPVILTHIYLLMGCALPLWLHPNLLHDDIEACLLSGLLSLGVGDTAASFIGTKYGKHKWFGSKKSIEGTIANVCAQMVALCVLQVSGLLVFVSWNQLVFAVVTTSLLEAFTTQIDNLILPLYMYITLIIH